MMETKLRYDPRYMLSRCLPLLLTDAAHWSPRVGPEGSTWIGLRLAVSTETSIRLPGAIFSLIHSTRLMALALHRLIPACDRDLPFNLKHTYYLAQVGTQSPMDAARTLASGALATNRAVYTEQVLDYATPETAHVAESLLRLMRYGKESLDSVDPRLRKSNPLVRSLSNECVRLLEELNRAVARRPQLRQALLSQGSIRRPLPRRSCSGLYRSVLNARRLNEQYQQAATVPAAGGTLGAEMHVPPHKVYEFWCFCEFTQRLLALRKYEVVQKSLLRTGLDTPVFAFGDNHYVYYEHRRNYFRLDDGQVIRLHRAEPRRGPEWFILRNSSPQESILMDCKYYRRHTTEMFDTITRYCQDYRSRTGVGFAACQPPLGVQRRKGLTEVDKCVLSYRLGNSSFEQIDVYLVPHPNYQDLNQAILDRLIEKLRL